METQIDIKKNFDEVERNLNKTPSDITNYQEQ